MKLFKFLIIFFCLFLFTSCDDDVYIPEDNTITTVETSYITIDLKGEVVRTGIYQVKSGTLLYDLIILAGGLTPQADTSNINLATTIEENQMINIPKKASENTTNSENNSSTETTNKVNINTASLSELMTLEKIGETIATRIIEYRESNGKFKTIEDIKNVKGISDGVFSKIKDYITV